MKKFPVFVTRILPQAGLDLLKKEFGGYEINRTDKVLPQAQLYRKIHGKSGILSLLTDRIDARAMDAAGPGLRVVSNLAVGYDNIDVKEATQRGIVVCNTPGVLTETTAEMAWALMFAAARRVVEADAYVRAGRFKTWQTMLLLGRDLTGKTLGVIGAGRIGGAFMRMSAGFKMKILYANRSRKVDLEKETGARQVPLETLLKESDFVAIHTNLNESTRHLIGAKELKLMKPTAILVNTARGPVIDEKALVQALRRRQIAGAGLDVFEREPLLEPGLAKLPNVVIAPHIASATVETRDKMATMAARNLILALRGESPEACVNPEVLA